MKEKSELESLRYERKFNSAEISPKDMEFLIKQNSALFREIFYERRVNNIYLDSLDFKNYQENISGVSERLKIRIRWYGSSLGMIKKPILELKMKKGDLGKKLVFSLKPFKFDNSFSYEKLKQVFLNSNLPDWLLEKLKFYFPKLFNFYTRKYFISSNKKYRITLDKDLVFYKINEDNNNFSEKVKEDEKIVLELKYSLEYSSGAQQISQEFNSRLTANSKYCSGISLLGL
jgi:SPX domain protein involved in polyphosphate accumulation